MSVFTASLGFLVHYPLISDFYLFLSLTIGTALAAGGAAALNQWMEREEDSLMPRTSERPLPSRLIEPEVALIFGVALSSIGLALLWIGTNPWACLLTLLTLVFYLLIYTPLKKRSPYATEVGAISGALPPLIGWVAASGEPSLYGWILFGILFTWQLPHFMAIAWNFRKDYERGGFKLQNLGSANGFHLARKEPYLFIFTSRASYFLLILSKQLSPAARLALFYFCLFTIRLSSKTSIQFFAIQKS
jgi:protoheme IX farnesyltransferase